jgi:outer membrane lipoprotein LolB
MNPRRLIDKQRQTLGFIGCWLLLLLATGCAGPPTIHDSVYGAQSWSGRIGLKTLSDPPQRANAMFSLEGSATQGQLLLLTPLGTALARAQWGPGYAQLQENGRITHFASMDELTTHMVGSALPVLGMFGWLKGDAAPVEGWTVQLERLADGRIDAQRSTPLPVTEIRILIDTPERQ